MYNVFNIHKKNVPKEAVYIGRPSKWGNPFVIGKDGTREEVIAKYKGWLFARPETLSQIKQELAGKNLACFCAPKPCHGDILLALANMDQNLPGGKI